MAKESPIKVRNVVHDDAIWRQTIHYEESTAQNWESNWGFMKDSEESAPSTSCKTPRLPFLAPSKIQPSSNSEHPPSAPLPPRDRFAPNEPRLPSLPDDNTTDLLMIYDIPRVMKKLTPVEKYAFPRTVNHDIGWLWNDGHGTRGPGGIRAKKPSKFVTLEIYGKHARGRGDVLKWWGGTRESMP